MKDEIKEIIQLIGNCCYHGEISEDKCKKYCDYITNLEQENERLKDIVIEKDSQIKEMILQKTDYTAVNILKTKLEDYKSRNEKANEYIKENTRWFDSEYAKIYGELVDCAGAKGDRLEVLVNPSNLSKILGGDKDVKEAKD